jgi:hypothetical protein
MIFENIDKRTGMFPEFKEYPKMEKVFLSQERLTNLVGCLLTILEFG